MQVTRTRYGELAASILKIAFENVTNQHTKISRSRQLIENLFLVVTEFLAQDVT